MYVLQKFTITLFQILFVAAFYAKTNVTSRALAIGRRHFARRQRIAPFDLRRASLPVSAAISIMFLDTLCSKKWYDMPHIECGIHSLQFHHSYWSNSRVTEPIAIFSRTASATWPVEV